MFKDMFGNGIKVGDYLAYAELEHQTRAVQNIYMVDIIDNQLRCTLVKSSNSYYLGKVKRLQCASEKAIILKDYKEETC